ncbi:DMT family transporter [Novosphingobium terrae]|uniref:DMT family transporter n=1 Tax=Novosphingobium terrae TaxID=2726189 RepID=UPI001980594B|nr:DMT family transporter [Novosphingobium terrae]
MTRTHHLGPVLAAAAGIATFAVMDALMKGASMVLGVFTALMWRNLLGSVLTLAAWWAAERIKGQRIVWPARAMLLVHALRAGLVCAMASLFFWGLVRTPMAVGMALSFIAPLIALYLSALFLGEPITRRALWASLIALLGVGVVAAGRLSDGVADSLDSRLGLGAILTSAVLYAGNLVLQRHQAQRAAPLEIAFFQGLFIALIMLPLSPWLAVLPGQGAFGWSAGALVAGAGVLASVSLALLGWGWARAEAHRLLPVEYSAFIWSALMGYLWFHEALSLWTLGGVALIVAGVWVGTAQRGQVTEQDGLPGELTS